MRLTRIEDSTSIAWAGYLDGAILILFRSGHWREFPGDEKLYAELLEAPSKGRFVRVRLFPRATDAAEPARTPLDTIAEDECCSKRLSRRIAAGLVVSDRWECPKCNTLWGAEPVEGLGRHWKPRTWSAVLR